jgi:hemoglobin-like flavoprotein
MSDLLQESAELLEANKAEIQQRFFSLFLGEDPMVADLFGAGSRPKQSEMMQQILCCVIDSVQKEPGLPVFLRATGETHNAYEVEPYMYDAMPDCMVRAMRDVCGQRWTPEMGELWSTHLRAICAEMKNVCEPGGDW